MLHDITWKQFGIAAVSAGLLYYLIILFKYYRLEIAALFAGQKEQPPVPENDHQIFGAAITDDSEMNLVNADELRFAEPDEMETPVKEQLLGDMADFMEELKVLLRITKEAEDTKENFIMLLQLLVGKHPAAASLRYTEPIALYLLEEGTELPFALSKDEIEEAIINTSFNED